jgi:hypothetical protein
MQSTFKIEKNKQLIKNWLLFFMLALVASGITAVPDPLFFQRFIYWIVA